MTNIIKSSDYHDYFIKDGELIGEFEQMYQNVADPWYCSQKSSSLDNDLFLAAVKHVVSTSAKFVKLLDIGCGLGALTERMRQEMPGELEIYACDVSKTAIEKAKKSYPGIHFFVQDLGHLDSFPVEPGSLDVITMSQLMWCVLPSIGEIIKHLHQLLKSSGHLVILQYFLHPDEQKYGKGVVEDAEDFIRLIRIAGFRIEREIYIDRERPQNVILWAIKDSKEV